MHRTDEELVRASARADEDAFAVLVSRFGKRIYNFAYRFTQNSQAAEDVVQETFLRAWQHVRDFRPGARFDAWLFAICRNAALDWLKKKKEIPFSDFETQDGGNMLLDEIADPETLPDELAAGAEARDLAERLLNALPARYRDVVLLRYTEQFTFEEIAQMLGKPLDTVKSQHRRALALLHRFLERAPK